MANKKENSLTEQLRGSTLNKYMSNDNLAGKNTFLKGIINDINDLFQNEDNFLRARNASLISPVGDEYSLSNELSNKLVAKAPYTIIGTVFINNGEWAIFSTDDNNCEIGIFNEATLEYTPYVNSKDLNFKKSNLIKGVGRIKRYCHRMVYWDDDLNPSRYMDFDDLKWKGKWSNDDCKAFIKDVDVKYEHQDKNNPNPELSVLDVNKILLSPSTNKGLSFELNKGTVEGELVNGTYVVYGYYSQGGAANPITNFYSLSNPQPIFSHNNVSGSLDVIVKDVDKEFEEFTLGICIYEQMNTSFYVIGSYSTSIEKISITHIDQRSGQFPFQSVFKKLSFPEKSAGIYNVSKYLLRIKPTEHQDFNYQPLANQIKTYWVDVEYPQDYYKNGGHNVGYMRDEVYSFFIRWVYNTGDKSHSYHIPGRSIGMGPEASKVTNDVSKKIKGKKLSDGGIVRNVGIMQYWESKEKYDDKKPEVWGDLCGKNIRHHKMPSTEVSKHFGYSDGYISGSPKIYVLGVHFENILPPTQKVKNEKGEWEDKVIENIVGYEILRGSREGNKSVIAKGIINNMRTYKSKTAIGEDDKTIYYQNYPYNSTQTDRFITHKMLQHANEIRKYEDNYEGYLKQENGKNEEPYKNNIYISKDTFSFHSPDTLYSQEEMTSAQYLSAKALKLYGEVSGNVDQLEFFEPKGTPKQKLMHAPALISAIVLGLGNALLKMDGRKNVSVTASNIDSGTTTQGVGAVEITTGQGSAQQFLQNAGAIATEAARKAWQKLKENLSVTTKASGRDFDQIISDAEVSMGLTTGALSGKSATITAQTESSAWKNIPGMFRTITGIPLFITSWGEGIEEVLNTIYAFGKYRNFTLQQTSHGLYDTFSPLKKGMNSVYNIEDKTYLMSSNMRLKDGSIINNTNRPKSVAVKLDGMVPFTKNADDSQVLWSDYQKQGIQHKTNISSYYAGLYQEQPSQYGQLQSVQQIPVSFRTTPINENEPVFFGGDTFVSRYTEKNTMFFFTDWLAGQPDGTEFNYSDYQAVSHPRFWMNTGKYDISVIVDSLASLFKTNNISDFDPFKLSPRFTDSTMVLQKSETPVENIETTFDIDVYNVDNDFYPDSVTTETIKKRISDLNALKNEIESLESEIELQKELLSSANESEAIKIEKIIESYNTDIEEKNDQYKEEKSAITVEASQLLSDYNSKRSCDCSYYYFLSDKAEHLTFDKRILDKFNNLKLASEIIATGGDPISLLGIKAEEEIYNLVTNKIFYSDEDVNHFNKQDAEFVYNRHSQISPINCEFFRYGVNIDSDQGNKKDKTRYIFDGLKRDGKLLSHGIEENDNFNKSYTKELWYVKPYSMTNNDYKKLCKLKNKQDQEDLKYAIALGYIRFLQQVVISEEKKDGETEEKIQSCLCWSKDGHGNENTSIAEVFTDDWEDDYDLEGHDKYYIDKNNEGMKNEGTGFFHGFAEGGIPYTRHHDELNPLLAYFIQEETTVRLNYPTKEEFINNWENTHDKSYDKFKADTYRDYPEIYQYNRNGDSMEKLELLNTKYFPVFKSESNMSDEDYNKAWKSILDSFDAWKSAIAEEEYDEDNEYFGLDVDNNNEVVKLSFAESKRYLDLGDINDENNSEWDMNKLMVIYMNIKDKYAFDQTFTSKDNRLKYWTIKGCQEILGLRSKKKIKSKDLSFISRDRYFRMDHNNDDTNVEVYKELKCKNFEKYFDNKGKLKRRVKKLKKNIEKANEKYNKQLQKFNDKYNDAIKNSDDSGILKNIRSTINNMTPGSFYALDGVGYGKTALGNKYTFNRRYGFFIRDMYMYTFVSGVRDFFVESTRNIGYRDWGARQEEHFYDHNDWNDLRTIFEEKIIKEPEYVKFYKSLIPGYLFYNSGFITNAVMQDSVYDPIEAAECLQKMNNRILYSNPDEDTQITDGWRVFKSNNHYDFNDEVTSCLSTAEHGAAILFKNSSPILFQNRVEIDSKTASIEVMTGTGELFTKNNLVHLTGFNSFESGSCQDSFSAINTPIGALYIGEDQGKVYTLNEKGPQNIAFTSGISKWFNRFMPYQLLKDKRVNKLVFANKEFELTDNPVYGIGCQTSFDNLTLISYFSKKDYVIKDFYIKRMLEDYDKYPIEYLGNGLFKFVDKYGLNKKVKLGDEEFFDDASFTISYDTRHNGIWTSFHDWHPDLTMSSSDRIYSTKDNGIYRHNDSSYGEKSYCNFYGKDYPFEVEFTIKADSVISTLRNVKYFLQTYVYSENEYDRFHTLFDNFDEAIIYNTEQISGLLKLHHQNESNPETIIDYPKIANDHIDILWSKEEQVYRFDQFWDITKDRMDRDMNTMFNTSPNGYVREINPKFVNYFKDEFERKKFRHMTNNVRLTKSVSGNVNFVFSFSINMNQRSIR